MEDVATLRAGIPADIPAMYALDLLCFDEPFRFDAEAMRHYATAPGAVVIVAECGWALAAFVIANVTRKARFSSAYISTLDVHPQWRRQGIAHRLMEALEKTLDAGGVLYVRLHVFAANLGAIAFYEAAGYRRTILAAAYYGPGLDAWIYVKSFVRSGGLEHRIHAPE